MERAYSLLTVKSIDEDQRIITGIATTPTPDRMGDVVEPKGAEFQLPIPLLWQHKSSEPIGEVFEAKVTNEGIEIKARVQKIEEPGKLKDRIDEAWQSIKYKLVRGLSIGFSSQEYSRLDNGGLRFLKWLWLELSAVTIPANHEANIQTVKAFSAGDSAAAPTKPLGVTSHKGAVYLRQDKPTMKTTAEQIKEFENSRAAKSARMNELQSTATTEGRTKSEQERQEFDTLKGEVEAIDAELKDLRDLEQVNKGAATPAKGDNPTDASKSRDGQHRIVVTDNLPKGIRFARYAMCIAASKGNPVVALQLAKAAYPDERGIHQYIERAAVGAATTANNQAPALQYTDWMGDFVDYLRPKTILGKFGTTQNGVVIPALRSAPFNVRINTQTAGGTGYWVGQGLPTPLTAGTYGTTTLDFMKVGTIAVLTKDEVRFASPSAEAKVRDDIAAAIVARMDIDFIDPTNAGTANVKPASITNGVVASTVSGTDYDNFIVDLAGMLANFTDNELDLSSIVLIMADTIAMKLGLMRTTLGVRIFPDISARGGMIEGLPVITSNHVKTLGSPSTNMIVAVAASDVYLADDGGVDIESSDQASLEMLDGSLQQNGTNGTGASLVSLWQAGLLGLKAERYVTWKKRRTQAAQYLSGVGYTPTAS
jgi:HK97 family phage major capsid protein/HK97 family phage prohead protease